MPSNAVIQIDTWLLCAMSTKKPSGNTDREKRSDLYTNMWIPVPQNLRHLRLTCILPMSPPAKPNPHRRKKLSSSVVGQIVSDRESSLITAVSTASLHYGNWGMRP